MNYKRILAAALCLCMTAPMATAIPAEYTSALTLADEEVQHFTDQFVYKIRGDYIEITAGMTNIEGDIEIPAEIDGIPVKVIGEHGLAGLSKVTSIKLPDTITTIRKQAFAYNTALETINIPENVRIIPDEAFMNCMSLGNVTIPYDLMSIGIRAFYGCRKITEMKFPTESLQSIGEMAFADCQGLAKINIPSRINKLESAVFSNCFALESLVLSENVTFISKDALPIKIKNLTIKSPVCELEDGLYMHITKDCVITAPLDSTAQKFAETYGLGYAIYEEQDVLVPGDVNLDWNFSIADLVMMKNYLLGNGDLREWQLGDMNDDGKVDSFDFVIMRQEILKTPTFNPPYVDPNLDYIAKNLCDDIQAGDVSGISLDSTFALSQTGFALDLFQHEYKNGTNTLISPYSVMQALAMTANGADYQTKADMEKVLGGIPVETLDAYLYTQRISQPDSESCKLKTANSIWIKNDGTIKVKPDFLQTVKDNFDSAVFEAPFDNTTVNDINKWVKINTDEMIPTLLKDIPEAAVMYLINAVSFDAEWQIQYDSTYNVGAGTFTAYDGTKQSCDMMHSRESKFISDDNSIGFMKDYSGGRYAFAAILPDENISIDDYIAGLTPESLHEMFGNSEYKKISAVLPKFSYDYDSTLSESLKDMGMESAFDAKLADFSKMGETVTDMLFINDVKHKTHIDVNESGTKAAAVTSVEMSAGDSADPPVEIRLNRPFVYCIVDTEVDVPIFIGTLNSID